MPSVCRFDTSWAQDDTFLQAALILTQYGWPAVTLWVAEGRRKLSHFAIGDQPLVTWLTKALWERLYLFETGGYNTMCHNGNLVLQLGTLRAVMATYPARGCERNFGAPAPRRENE